MRGPLVIVGDLLLDVDVTGTATRLSPEAPVPVVDVTGQRHRPGGAGLAALLAARDHDDVVLIGALGRDDAAETLLRLLTPYVDVQSVPLTGTTVTKTRIEASGLPITRLDRGHGRAAGGSLRPGVAKAIAQAGAILVADYGRGVAALPELRDRIAARTAEIPVVWDPHPRGANPTRDCALVTPNHAEAAALTDLADPAEQGRRLAERWDARAVAVTLGAHGALVVDARSGRSTAVPVDGDPRASDGPTDTCGAGDQFAAAAAGALLDGADAFSAVRTAVARAAAYVRAGAAGPLSTVVPEAGAAERTTGASPTDALELVERVRRSGGRVVATGGCFDLLHRGHVDLLQHARTLGDVLVVCLNSDASVRRAKGPDRPLVREDDRSAVLLALGCVDGVVVFDEPTPTRVLDLIRPDVWVKGADYAGRPMPEADLIARFGGEIVLAPLVPGYSTTRLVRAAHDGLSRTRTPVPTPAGDAIEDVS